MHVCLSVLGRSARKRYKPAYPCSTTHAHARTQLVLHLRVRVRRRPPPTNYLLFPSLSFALFCVHGGRLRSTLCPFISLTFPISFPAAAAATGVCCSLQFWLLLELLTSRVRAEHGACCVLCVLAGDIVVPSAHSFPLRCFPPPPFSFFWFLPAAPTPLSRCVRPA